MVRKISILVLAGVLTACNSIPESGEEGGITPSQLANDQTLAEKGAPLRWGGEIVAVQNLTNNTVLQIIAYPLNDTGEPVTSAAPLGRFLADQKGFLEPREFRPGRRVTVSGPLLGFQDTQIGEAVLPLPALDIQQLQLWTNGVNGRSYRQPRVNVGISGGSHGSGVGIGIGF